MIDSHNKHTRRTSTILPTLCELLRRNSSYIQSLCFTLLTLAALTTPRACGQQTPSAENTQQDQIAGQVLDPAGRPVSGAQVAAINNSGQQVCHAVTLPAGNFLCSNLPVGEYSLTVTASDFAPANLQRIHPGGSASTILTIVLPLQSQNIIVSVSATTQEVAQAQIEAEEKQRIIAIFPNFYTAYDPQAVPLTSRQKFSLATHDLLDPVTFLTTGVSAAIEQANNSYPTWGQGAAGYGKRYAAAYGDGLTSDLFRHAIYASLFHQDPRYYYQGTGSFSSRLLHAISYSVSLRGDDGSLHPNYSYVAGYLTSGAISNAYYPASKRGIHLVLDRAAFGVAGTAGEGFLREFIFNHLTTHRAAKP